MKCVVPRSSHVFRLWKKLTNRFCLVAVALLLLFPMAMFMQMYMSLLILFINSNQNQITFLIAHSDTHMTVDDALLITTIFFCLIFVHYFFKIFHLVQFRVVNVLPTFCLDLTSRLERSASPRTDVRSEWRIHEPDFKLEVEVGASGDGSFLALPEQQGKSQNF